MTKHKVVSLIKSGVRIIGCGCGLVAFYHNPALSWVYDAFLLLLFAELIGILEEEFE